MIYAARDAADALRDGDRPGSRHAGDMRSQIDMTLDNLEAVLAGAAMTSANLVRLAVFATDRIHHGRRRAMKHFDLLGARLGPAGVRPPTTLLGVTRLAFPELMIEIEATAAD